MFNKKDWEIYEGWNKIVDVLVLDHKWQNLGHIQLVMGHETEDEPFQFGVVASFD